MKSKASAPGKVILFGEHFVVYGLKAILCAIDKRITVTAQKISENKISIRSNIGSLEEKPKKPISKINGKFRPFYYLADKMIEKHDKNSGIEIIVESEIPSGVGLGSSSACCVAGAAAISGVFCKLPKEEILKLAIEAEKTIFPNTSGADCTVCTFGGIMKYDKQNGHSRIDFEPDFQLVIANSNISHSTKEIVAKVNHFKKTNEEVFFKICKEEEELIDDVLICIKNSNLSRLGLDVRKNQEYLELIGVSNEKLKEMINTANKSSFGSKITGAGGGGCIFAITDETNVKETSRNLQNYNCFTAKIDFRGLDTF